jgi:hypothetical protein
LDLDWKCFNLPISTHLIAVAIYFNLGIADFNALMIVSFITHLIICSVAFLIGGFTIFLVFIQ